MTPQGKADPAIYPKLRQNAFAIRLKNLGPDAIQVVLMDWPLANGMMTVLAAADGSASIYLSSGGGFIGGGQNEKWPDIRAAALHSIDLAATHHPLFRKTTETPLPPPGTIRFYLSTSAGVTSADATEASLRNATSPLLDLGNSLQAIVTGYRLMRSKS